MNRVRTPEINAALEQTISRERLEKYFRDQGNDLDRALTLYERNIQLCEAIYVPLQALEVCLRNKVHRQMSSVYGPAWLTDPTAAPLNGFSRSLVNQAVGDIDGPLTPGKIVAELKFAFWVGLMGPHYDESLWRRALHVCFRNGGGKKRARVHGRFNAIRRLRNRVAHHEPIYHKPIGQLHDEILEAIGWMCTDTQAWTAHHSRVAKVLDSN